MPYPIITPAFYRELTGNADPESSETKYSVLMTPAAVEYIFPLNQESVVRKLMSISDTMEYKMITLKPEEEAEYSKRGEELIEKNPVLKNYWTLKTVTMNILQNRNYAFEKRMLLMNFVYKTVQGMLDKLKEEHIVPFTSEFMRSPEHPDVMKYFEEIRPNFAYSLCDGLSFIRTMPDADGFGEVREDVFANAGCDIGMKDFKFDESRYLPMKKAYYEDFLKGREHYIENIMINYVWTYCMPYADFNMTLWDNFVFYNTLFNTVKVILTCYTFNKQDKDEAFVKAVTAFDSSLRAVEGNIISRIVDANVKEGLANNGDMAILAMS